MENTYWFAKSGDELTSELAKRIDSFQKYILDLGLIHVWNKNRAFYENRMLGGSDSISNDIIDTGDIGELKAMSFNHFRNILRHIVNSLTSNDPVFDVSATNTDIRSRRSAKIGRDLVNYYYKTKRLNKTMHETAEKAVVYGDGFIAVEFNPSIGKIVTIDQNGRYIREGDFEFESLSPINVFYDPTKKCLQNWDWVTFRRKRNKYDLASIFPKQKEKILALKINYKDDPYSDLLRDRLYNSDSDDVWLYSTYHRANNVLPKGKYILWCGTNENPVPLYENDNPYRDRLPIFGLSPAHYMETSFGFTEANILRSAQMALTIAVSSMVTNMNAGSVMNIWKPSGANLSLEELSGSLNVITSDVKPEVIDFYRENPGLSNMMGLCINTMETLSGQSAVVRGNIAQSPNLKSGIAIATVINQAQEYSQTLQQTYFEMFEDITTFLLQTLKEVASEQRLYEICGKSQRSAVATFTSKDLDGVSRVIIDRTNPIAKTPSGKIEIAMELLKTGIISPKQFFDVMNTGNLNVATEADERMLDYIANVKEKLLAGEQVAAIPGIDHQLFIKEIQSLLYDIDLINNTDNAIIVQNITNLITAHMQLVRNGDELAAMIYGGQAPSPNQVSNDELDGDVTGQEQALSGIEQAPSSQPMPSAKPLT
jgi:hypothetical protein